MGSSNYHFSIRSGKALAEKVKRFRLNAKVGEVVGSEAEVSATSRRSDKAATSLRSPCKGASSVAGRKSAPTATSAVTGRPTCQRFPWWSGFIGKAGRHEPIQKTAVQYKLTKLTKGFPPEGNGFRKMTRIQTTHRKGV